MKQALTHIILLALVLCPSESTAQNDACGASTVLACGAVVSGNSALYTADVAPFCGTGDGTAGGLWYRFIGTGNNVTASLCGSAYDTRVSCLVIHRLYARQAFLLHY